MDDYFEETLDLGLTANEGYALMDAVTVFFMVRDGALGAAADLVADGDDGNYMKNHAAQADAAATKIREAIKNTQLARDVRKVMKDLEEGRGPA